MTRFYGYESALHGYSMLRRVFNDSDWALSAHFPRVTHCDLLVRQFGNDLPLTVQCVLYCVLCAALYSQISGNCNGFTDIVLAVRKLSCVLVSKADPVRTVITENVTGNLLDYPVKRDLIKPDCNLRG